MKTVRMRIAVAVNPDGTWGAAGFSDADDCAWDCLYDSVIEAQSGHSQYFITAELPIPSIPEVAGEVEEVKP